MAHCVFNPDPRSPRFFLFGRSAWIDEPVVARLRQAGTPAEEHVLVEDGTVQKTEGMQIPLREAIPLLAGASVTEAEKAAPSIAAWSLAAKLALELVGRERIVPRVRISAGTSEARWGIALSFSEDADRVAALARAMPLAAHALPVVVDARPARVWAPDALLRAFLDATADTLARESSKGEVPAAPGWEWRFARALTGSDPAFAPQGFGERTLPEMLERWATPAVGASRDTPRTVLRILLPPEGETKWRIAFALQAASDPDLMIDAEELWRGARPEVARAFKNADEHLLRSLAEAAERFPPIHRGLEEQHPTGVDLDENEAWQLLTEAAVPLHDSGIGVQLPPELMRAEQQRLRIRMVIGGGLEATSSTAVAGVVSGSGPMGLGAVLSYRWELALGSESVTPEELEELVKAKRPLIRWRGEWVAIDPSELEAAYGKLAEAQAGTMRTDEALVAALTGKTVPLGAMAAVEVVTEGSLADVVKTLREHGEAVPIPKALHGTLRAYQERGLTWMAGLARLGLGGCLADDMGLGKTIQTIVFLLHWRTFAPDDRRPALLVCPMSVVGNWERELERFGPSLKVRRHHGASRPDTVAELQKSDAVWITTYGVVRRDEELLSQVDFATVVLDEAQNVKNAGSRQAKSVRKLHATHRFALTGTPIENRLAELWSILDFTTPGLLGGIERFKREFAVPIERYRDEEAAERLRKLAKPFVLRRLKSDPDILPDLPPQEEQKVICTLTKEQAALYQAAVDESMRKIREAEGIERRGQVLALLTALKQVCNHPAHYLGDDSALAGRSGKLARLGEMLEEVVESGERALVFTQYREMGNRLVKYLDEIGMRSLFLHGSLSRTARDAMVKEFQESPDAPPVFILSLKAGGTGLNLTRATHVFHFDRWWNPAVEDQATDRAHRIGQTRVVQVHKLVTAGTLEEKVDRMLEEKKDLADRVVGKSSEAWLTELDDKALRDLVTLSRDAVVGDLESEEPE